MLERSTLKDLDREYSLYEIAIITRAAPARILGLKQKGHLGVGADADVTIYTPSANKRAMFEMPRFVLKAGQVVVEQGEVRAEMFGPDAARRSVVRYGIDSRHQEVVRGVLHDSVRQLSGR